MTKPLLLSKSPTLIFKVIGGVFLWGLILWNTGLLFKNAQQLSLHDDEYQHTHIAWNTLRGKVIYRDFQDTHGPLSALFYSFLLKIKARDIESASTFFYLRYFNIFVIFLTLWMLGVTTFELSPQKRVVAFALLLFISAPVVNTMGFRIRPDCYVSLFSILSLYAWLKSRYLFMGLCLGLAIGFHAKYLPINLIVLFSIGILNRKNLRSLSAVILGESFVLLSLAGWFWYHRALSFAWDSWWASGFRVAQKRLLRDGDINRLARVVTQFDKWMLVFWVASVLLGALCYYFRKEINWTQNLLKAAVYCLACMIFLFSPVWSHALIFVVPSALPFLVSMGFRVPKFEKVFISLFLFVGVAWSFMNLEVKDRGKELFADQLRSLEVALRETQRTEPIFHVWTSRCPAYVFNEDPSRIWMGQYKRSHEAHPIRILPPINYVAFHPIFLAALDAEERDYLQSHFKADGCFWSRTK